jgi:hypothetical protein
MKRKPIPHHPEFFGVVWQAASAPKFRLRAGDVIRIGGKLCRVVRVNECAAVVLMNRLPREFVTRFDRRVKFQQPPAQFRISPNAEVPILNR